MSVCSQHHRMLERGTFFSTIGILVTVAGLVLAFSIFRFASSDNMVSVQRQVDDQKAAMRDLRREMNARFDRIDKKLDALAGFEGR